MQASDTHIKWVVGNIDNEFWYDQITEALHHCEWVRKWHAAWVSKPDLWYIDIHDDEGEIHTISPLDVLDNLTKSWMQGDRSFEEEQQVDQDVIDALLQGICFGELVYG